MFKFDLSDKYPAVERLAVHLPNEQLVYYDPTDEKTARGKVSVFAERDTTLTAWFKSNSILRVQAASGDNVAALQLSYLNFVRRWTFNDKAWQIRKKLKDRNIGRLYMVSPREGERYYLRSLLTVRIGCTSWHELLQGPDGSPYRTFKSAALAWGLLADDTEWSKCLEEAALVRGGCQLRELFILLLTEKLLTSPTDMFDKHCKDLSDDFIHHSMQPDDARVLLLLDLELRLQQVNSKTTLRCFELPPVAASARERVLRLVSVLPPGLTIVGRRDGTDVSADFAELFAFHAETEAKEFTRKLAQANAEQRAVFDELVAALPAAEYKSAGGMFFLDGPGGTGKSFLLQLLLHHERKDGFLPLATASTGIASTLLPGCRTVHSRFRVPINITAESICNVKKNSPLAVLLRDPRVRMVIIDESPMLHRHVLECLDRTLRDLRSRPESAFGGLLLVLAGDFRQCLPVVQHGSEGDILRACLFASSLWSACRVLRLRENMRLRQLVQSGSGEAAQEIADFAT